MADLLPSRADHRKLEDLLSKLRVHRIDFQEITGDELTLLDARALFDGLFELRPSMTTYLSPDAEIVHSPVFEAAVVKVLAAEVLSTAELTSSTAKEGFADQILKRRNFVANPSTYMLLSAIPPTSNRVERLFSIARAVVRDERHRLLPMTLEMILFLKVNGGFWDVATVDACLEK
ncbi:hypothetical protein F443_11669 [Phytophthora nicotianae P1569]|uniref:HAT C-terminal dimerisation domain-containing protein n=3 Tax=Phytophthora nicotianae TaxID=4792 RepID=V9EZ87_PHYNI|nr:hypothetical protein F443_11669 [Phytophthora nicotianae P1569]